MKCLSIALALLSVVTTTHAFVQVPKLLTTRKSATPLRLTSEELTPAIEGARTEAFLWLFGSSGAAGLARRQFPKMFENSMAIRKMKDEGPTLGGETVGISPLCGYPQDLCKADVMQVVNNPKTVEEIVEENPYPENFLASKGYLLYQAFVDANKDCNPLAVRAVFDTFSQSTNVVDPDVAQSKLDAYKADPSCEKLKNGLLYSKFTGFAAIFALLFLLGLADVYAFRDASLGWFPDWPGRQNFPESIWKPGLWTIPDYWI